MSYQFLIPQIEHRVAALFVQPSGVYSTMPDVDAWPESRDARSYSGKLPVIAHPPCASWGNYSKPTLESTAKGPLRGDDNGCFESALASVRRCGGVIEHPQGSKAWGKFGLPTPTDRPDSFGGWTILVFQSWFGHFAIKPTWLYIVGNSSVCIFPSPLHKNTRPLENLAKEERAATPLPFARFLFQIAVNCRESNANVQTASEAGSSATSCWVDNKTKETP